MTNQVQPRMTIKMSVMIEKCPTVFIEGEPAGIIATQNVTFEAPSEHGVKEWQVSDMLKRKSKELLDSVVNVKLEYVPK